MSNVIKELRDKQETIIAAARERLDQINSATDEARAKELEIQHDTAMKEFERLDAQIARETELAEVEARHKETEERSRQDRRPSPPAMGASGVDEGAALTYRSAFHAMLKAGGDLGALSLEERSLLRYGVAKGETRAQTVGTDAQGGFLVPTEMADQIVVAMKASGPMYDDGMCTLFNTSSGNPITIPTVDDTNRTADLRAEATPILDDGTKDMTVGQKILNSYVYSTGYVRFSMELVADSAFNVENLLSDLLGTGLGRAANEKLTNGSGTNEPHGVANSAMLGKTTASASAITADEIMDLLHSVDPAYRQSAKVRFMFNDSTLAAIRKLKDGQGNYLWQMGDVTKGAPGTLLGYQYKVNQAMDNIATGKKPILFGDFGKYFVRKVGIPAIGVLRERFHPDLAIAGLVRFDGKIGDEKAIKHMKCA